ncbi:hypothetical protein T484DRAFT_1756141 [Baffinella frigidus]|nr:hypothetical protein T484DRAFT_1756141 [Cryptophyta sp. CCMP2293]
MRDKPGAYRLRASTDRRGAVPSSETPCGAIPFNETPRRTLPFNETPRSTIPSSETPRSTMPPNKTMPTIPDSEDCDGVFECAVVKDDKKKASDQQPVSWVRQGKADKNIVNPSKAIEMRVEVTVEWKKLAWQTMDGTQTEISMDVPPVVDNFTFSDTDGNAHVHCEYKQGGTKVSYDMHQLPMGVEYDTKSQTNPYLTHCGGVPTDCIKINWFSKRPPSVVNTVSKTVGVAGVASERPNKLSMHLAGGWIPLVDLAGCMQGNPGGKVLMHDFQHNFSCQVLQVQFSDAAVTIDGVRYTDGPKLLAVLKTQIDTGRIRTSMMHTMEARSEVLIGNLQLIGANIANTSLMRTDSIGGIMRQPLSLLLQHKEVVPLKSMGDLAKSYVLPVCPVMGGHFLAHALNLNAIPAWDADKGAPLLATYTRTRVLTTDQIIRVLHTTLQAPTYSAELVPYTSDCVLTISPETVTQMRTNTFNGVFTGKDAAPSECIDSVFSVPNALSVFRADDCEGSAHLTLAMQHNVRALGYDAASYLKECGTPAGREAMSTWINSPKFCNISLKREEEYAFAVQCVVVSATSHLCFDAKLLIIGAMCPTPLQAIAGGAKEQGHAASAAKVLWKEVGPIATMVYAHYTNPATRFTLLKMPILEGATAIGRPLGATPVQLAGEYEMHAPSVTIPKPINTLPKLAHVPDGFGRVWPTIKSGYPIFDVAAHNRFFVIESTTPLHMCAVKGHVSAARMEGIAKMRSKMGGAAVGNIPVSTAAVPIEEFFKKIEVAFAATYIDKGEDVRLQGYIHDTHDPVALGEAPRPVEFYKTFYQMDGFMLSEIAPTGNIIIGADADNLLNAAEDSSTRITMEHTMLPILTPLENDDMTTALRVQWEETRLPFIGMPALRQMISTWHPATIGSIYHPEDDSKGLMRCNIGISGNNADKLYTDMSIGGSLYIPNDGTNQGVIGEQRVIRMGCETTIISHGVRCNQMSVGS